MSELANVNADRKGPVATVTLDRPEVHNAFNQDTIAGLHDALCSLDSDGDVRVVILRVEGRSFSAGADLDWPAWAATESSDV